MSTPEMMTKLEALSVAYDRLSEERSKLERRLVLADAKFRKQFPERYAMHSAHRITLVAPVGVAACCGLEVCDDRGAEYSALHIELNVDDLRQLGEWLRELLAPSRSPLDVHGLTPVEELVKREDNAGYEPDGGPAGE